jgi:hypothetical protein
MAIGHAPYRNLDNKATPWFFFSEQHAARSRLFSLCYSLLAARCLLKALSDST